MIINKIPDKLNIRELRGRLRTEFPDAEIDYLDAHTRTYSEPNEGRVQVGTDWVEFVSASLEIKRANDPQSVADFIAAQTFEKSHEEEEQQRRGEVFLDNPGAKVLLAQIKALEQRIAALERRP